MRWARVALFGLALATGSLFAMPRTAWAGSGGGDAWGSVHHRRITATATYHRPGRPTSPTTTTTDPPTTSPPGGSDPTTTTLPPTAPYCTYTPAPGLTSTLGVGGATPGEWYYEQCYNEGFVNPMPAVWIPDPTPTTQPPPPSAVPAIASQALGNASLVSPTIVLNPVGAQVTNFASWLAISPADWHPVTATADDGGVAVTVTATPTAVEWNFGNGSSLSCPGPGAVYDPSKPDDEQSTYCSYTWPAPSFNQPGGTYDVTATIEYQVTTTVTGATNTTPDLGTHLGPTAHDAVRVTEVEALGT